MHFLILSFTAFHGGLLHRWIFKRYS